MFFRFFSQLLPIQFSNKSQSGSYLIEFTVTFRVDLSLLTANSNEFKIDRVLLLLVSPQEKKVTNVTISSIMPNRLVYS